MSTSQDRVIAQGRAPLLCHRVGNRKVFGPSPMPGVMIILHGVNDPGASFETIETGLCQGLNERLDRVDLCSGAYGVRYKAANKVPMEKRGLKEELILSDPDTYLYQRSDVQGATRSPALIFTWGYRAAPDEIKRDPLTGDAATLRNQYLDINDNRLDENFAKGGGFFLNATTDIPTMYQGGYDDDARRIFAQTAASSNGMYFGKPPHRRYFPFAAERLAMLIGEIRRVDPNETITVIGHSQGTLLTLLAQAMLIARGERCADCIIMVDTPYRVEDMPPISHEERSTLDVLIGIVEAVTASPHPEPEPGREPISADCSDTYAGYTGPRWSPEQGQRLGKDGVSTIVFAERDNRGKVFLYFCPEDTTVGLGDISGIGTFGLPDTVKTARFQQGMQGIRRDGTPRIVTSEQQAMQYLKNKGFHQRLWTKRLRDGKPVCVGRPPCEVVLREPGERRYAGDGGLTNLSNLVQRPIKEGEARLINGPTLSPEHAPELFGGEAIQGTDTSAGKDAPDAVAINVALGNPEAKFHWIEVSTSSRPPDPEMARGYFNADKPDADDKTREMRVTKKLDDTQMGWVYVLEREETPNEVRDRVPTDTTTYESNSYHSAVLRHSENHRWVTAMDVAIGQAYSMDDPDWLELFTLMANWRTKPLHIRAMQENANYSRLSPRAQRLIEATYEYYQTGAFPPTDLVSLTPPPLPIARHGASGTWSEEPSIAHGANGSW